MNRYFKFDIIPLICISLALALSDWLINFFSFGDFFIMIALLTIAMKNTSYIYSLSKKQLFIILGIIILSLCNIALNIFFNTNFIVQDGIKGIIKICYYTVTIVCFYNYITKRNLTNLFFKVLLVTGMGVCCVGIYITIVLLTNSRMPYEFLWQFTRNDTGSYMLYTASGILIRTRSVFSEPAHLGFYLNTLLLFMYFNKEGKEISKGYEIILFVCIILTFSFATIGCTMVILILKYVRMAEIKRLVRKPTFIMGASFLIMIIIQMWNYIYVSIFERAQTILAGEDMSAIIRLVETWKYINNDNIFIGNGLGNTVDISNVYAYILSDLGIIAFLIYIGLTIWICIKNIRIGIGFIILNFAKGGYLASGYWILILGIFLCCKNNFKDSFKDVIIEN